MSDQPPSNPLQSIISVLQWILDLFVSAIQSRDIARLALLLIAILILCFNFDIAGLKQRLEESPSKEIFWLTISALFITSLVFELRKRSQLQPSSTSSARGEPRRSWMRSHWVRYCMFGLVTSLLTFFLSGGLSELRKPVSAGQPSKYMCTDDRDCFSWGEDLLIGKDAAFTVESGEEVSNWKGKCSSESIWKYKENGVSAYREGTSGENSINNKDNIDSAISNFGNFVIESNCPNDPEAQIYLSNAKAEKAGNSLRVVVSAPISRKFNDEEGDGTSVALEILRGVALAQHEINADNSLGIGSKKKKLIVGIVDDGPIGEEKPPGEAKISYERRVAEAAAKFVVQNQSVLGVIGHFTSDATQAASKTYGTHKLVSISPTATAIRESSDYPSGTDFLFKDDNDVEGTNYVFRTAPDDSIAVLKLKDEISKRGENFLKMAVIYESGSRYSESFRDAFRKVYESVNGDMFTDADNSCDLRDDNIQQNARSCRELLRRESGLKALLLVPSNASSDKLRGILGIPEGNNSENSERPFYLGLLGADSMYDETFLTESTEGMLVAIPWHRSSGLFESQATNLFGYQENGIVKPFEINWRTAMAYDATKALAEGLARASESCKFSPLAFWNRQAESECLRDKLRVSLSDTSKFKADGAFGPDTVQFDEKGDRKASVEDINIGVLVKVCKREGKYIFEHVDECP